MLKFSLFKFPVVVGLEFFLLAVFLGMHYISVPALLVSWIAVVFCSILIHELGHAFAFRFFGFSPRIRLHSFGGETSITGGRPLKPWQDVLITLAGPLAGLLLGGSLSLLYLFLPHSPLLDAVMDDVRWVNFGWSLINLLPLFPLDGGRITKAAFTYLFKKKGELGFYIFSMAAALAAAAISLYFELYLTALISGFLFFNNLQAFRYATTVGVDSGLKEEFNLVYKLLEENRHTEARDKAEGLYTQAQSLPLKSLALNLTAWSFYKQGEYEQALTTLERHADPERKDLALLAMLLYETKRYTEAKTVLLRLFARQQVEQVAWPLFKTLEALGDGDTLYTAVMRYPGSPLSRELYLAIAAFLHANGKFKESFDVSALLFHKLRVPVAAFNAACAQCRLGDRRTALKWLEKAVKSGFRDPAALASDPDIACLKQESKYQELLQVMQTGATDRTSSGWS